MGKKFILKVNGFFRYGPFISAKCYSILFVTLQVANKFSGSSLESGFAVSDEMIVSLRNMKISKTTLISDLSLGEETRILEEVTLSVQVICNVFYSLKFY